jgi:predicted ATPase
VAGFGQELPSNEASDPGSSSEIDAVQRPSPSVESRAHFIGHLLGYDFRGSNHLASIVAHPQQLRDRALSYLQDYFKALCSSGPVLVLLEDLHWADDSSLEVFSMLSLTLHHQPLLVVGATRPELFERRPDWYERKSIHMRLDLQPLSEKESRTLVIEVLQKKENVPAALLELVVSNAEGNPFYVEELLKMLVQHGVVVKEGDSWQVRAEQLAEVKVPPTLSGVLQARLDSLAKEERAVLQQASVVGRIFWDVAVIYLNRQFLEAKNEEPDEDYVKKALHSLQEKEIVFDRDLSVFAGANEYIFKHALFRQVTYESVLIRSRRTFHSLVADWLIKQSGERSEEVTGLIANHLEQAGRLEEALIYLSQAGERAAQLYALIEALRFYDQAVELVKDHPKAFSGEELAQLRSKRGDVHALAGEFEAAAANIDFALQAAKDSSDLIAQRTLLTNLGMVYRRWEDYENALSHLRQAVEVARASGDQRAVADTLYHLGSVIWSQGENNEATMFHQEALEISRSLDLSDIVAVQAVHGRAEAYWIDGRPDVAIQLFEESLQLSRQIGNRSYEAENLQMIGIVSYGPDALADYGAARKAAEEALEICRSAHLDWHLAPTLSCLSQAYKGVGDYQRAYQLLQEVNQLAKELGALRFLSYQFHYMAVLYLDLGLLEQAVEIFEQALQASKEANTAFSVPLIEAGLAVTRLRQGGGREQALKVGLQLEETLATALRRGQNLHAAYCYEVLTEVEIVAGKYEKAFGYIDRLLKIAEPGGMRERMAQAHRWRGVALQALGRMAAAGEELNKAAGLAQAIGSPRMLWDVHDALSGYYDELGNAELAAHHREEVQKIVGGIAAGLEEEELKAGLPLDSN